MKICNPYIFCCADTENTSARANTHTHTHTNHCSRPSNREAVQGDTERDKAAHDNLDSMETQDV